MKNFFLVIVLVVAANSSSAFAKEKHSVKYVKITFSEDDTKTKLPESEEDKKAALIASQHTPSSKDFDTAIEDLF